jgi:hypothetical protein
MSGTNASEDETTAAAKRGMVDQIVADINKLYEEHQSQISNLFAANPLGTVDAVGDPYRRRWSVRRAARFLDCDPATVRRLVDRGVLHATRESARRTRLDIQELELFKAGGMAAVQQTPAGSACSSGAQPETGVPSDDLRFLKPRSIAWAAAYCQRTPRTILRAVRAGRLRSISYSLRTILVDEDQVIAFAAQSYGKRPGGPDAPAASDACLPAGTEGTPGAAVKPNDGAREHAIVDTDLQSAAQGTRPAATTMPPADALEAETTKP